MQGKQRGSGVCEAAYQGRVCFYENDVVSLCGVFVNKPETIERILLRGRGRNRFCRVQGRGDGRGMDR